MRTRNFVWYWNIIHYSVYTFLKKQSFTNPAICAGGFLVFLIAIINWSIFNLCQVFFQTPLSEWVFKKDTNHLIFLAIVIGSAILFNYLILFRDDKYEGYFTDFDEMDSDEKNKCFWISAIVVLLILVLFIFSFKYIR